MRPASPPCPDSPSRARPRCRSPWRPDVPADLWKPCILVVDDEPYVPRVLEMKFARAGWRTITARSGHDGLLAIERERPDVVITDISMPGMSGYDLCRESQRYRESNPFLLIVVT